MTSSNSRKKQSRTLIEQLGFDDMDLKTPGHDEIMLWLDQSIEARLPAIYRDLTGWLPKWSDSYLSKRYGEVTESFIEWAKIGDSAIVAQWRAEGRNISIFEDQIYTPTTGCKLPDIPSREFVVQDKIWEWPISDGKFVAGFLDLLCNVSCTGGLQLPYHRDFYGLEWYETPGRIIWSVSNQTSHFAFGVKTSIPSAGELIRQIRFYQSKRPDLRFFVVSPETKWADLLASQGIGHIEYPTGKTTLPAGGIS